MIFFKPNSWKEYEIWTSGMDHRIRIWNAEVNKMINNINKKNLDYFMYLFFITTRRKCVIYDLFIE